jgi:hypothetical protein
MVASPAERKEGSMSASSRQVALLDSITAEEALLLIRAPYDSPSALRRAGRKTAEPAVFRLVARGLLERNPESDRMFRCTERGEELRILVEASFASALRRRAR